MLKLVSVFFAFLMVIGQYSFAQTAAPEAPPAVKPKPPEVSPLARVGPVGIVFVAPSHIDVNVVRFGKGGTQEPVFHQSNMFELTKKSFLEQKDPLTPDEQAAFVAKLKEVVAQTNDVGVKHPLILLSNYYAKIPQFREFIASVRQKEHIPVFILPSPKEAFLAFQSLKAAKAELKDQQFVLWYGDSHRVLLLAKGEKGLLSYQGPALLGDKQAAPLAEESAVPVEETVPSTEEPAVHEEQGAAPGSFRERLKEKFRDKWNERRQHWKERHEEKQGASSLSKIKEIITANHGKVYGAGDLFTILANSSKDETNRLQNEITIASLEYFVSGEGSHQQEGHMDLSKVASALIGQMKELGVESIEVVPLDLSQSVRGLVGK